MISIPVFLLWRVRLSLRRKLALGGTLCLSIFMIVIVIIKVSTGTIADGQVDSPWVLYWLHVEAAVAVVVVSMTAFRVLFVRPGDADLRKHSNQNGTYQKGMTRTSPSSRTEVSSSTKNDFLGRDDSFGSVEMDFPFQEYGITVPQEVSSHKIRE